MKKMFYHYFVLITIIFIIVLSCRKSGNTLNTDENPPSAVVPFPQNFTMNCPSGPDYGDSILYTQPTNGNSDYIVTPVNNPGTGRYLSWPEGMVIDSSTGAINLSQSEVGERYMIGFVKRGTTDTCLKTLILGGASYVDSIYNLSKNDTLAHPYFDANPVQPSICNSSDDSDYPGNGNGNGDGDNKCQFDGPDKKGKRYQVNSMNIKIRSKNGIINLMRTMQSGAFGANPVDGQVVNAMLFYNLNDNSKKAIQQLPLRIMYYHNLAAVPRYLINYIRSKRTNILNSQMTTLNGKPRPPLIIVIR
jgi:hypothetical protein